MHIAVQQRNNKVIQNKIDNYVNNRNDTQEGGNAGKLKALVVSLIIYRCANETPIFKLSTTIFQALIDIFGEHMAFSSRTPP